MFSSGKLAFSFGKCVVSCRNLRFLLGNWRSLEGNCRLPMGFFVFLRELVFSCGNLCFLLGNWRFIAGTLCCLA